MGDVNIEAGVENLTIKVKPVLGEKDANIEISEENLCGFCKKSDPTKRCSKRHPKFLKKLFCNETCEIAAHKKKEDPAAVAAKAAAKKAAEKKQNQRRNFFW